MANKEEELAAATDEVIRNLQQFGYVLPATQARLMDAQTSIKNFGFKVDVATKTVGKLGDAVANTAKAMYNGEKGAGAFNKSVDDMADAAQIAAVGLSLLAPGGPLMKAAVAGITYLATSAMKAGAELTKTANLQSDALYNAFQKMSASGASASDGMTGVFNDLQNLGLGIQDLDGYVNLINDSSKDLALFGSTVYKGRQAFADMNKEMAPFTEQLYNAGLTQQDIAKGAMEYLKLQTTLGRSQTMTNKQLADGARKYLLEQDALAKLTGQSRQEMEAQQQAALMEEQYAAKIRELELQGNTQAVESLKKMNAVYSAAGPEVGRAFRASVTGNLTNADALKYNISSQGEMIKTTEEVIAGQRDWKDAVTTTGRAIGDTADSIGTTLGQVGTYNEIFGNFSEQQKLRLMTEKDIGKKYDEINTELENQGVTGKKARDELQQTQTEIRLQQKEAMLATQELVQLAVPSATKAMLSLAEAANAAAQALLGQAKAETIAAPTGPVSTVEQQKASAKTSAGTGGTVIEGAVVGGGGGEGDAGAIMAAAGEAPPPPPPKDAGFFRKYFNVGAEKEAPAAPSASGGPGATAPGAKTSKPGGAATSGVSSYSDKLVDYIKNVEGFVAKAFWDKKQYTNGYGTQAAGPDEVIDKQEAEKRLRDNLQKAVGGVINYGKSHNYNWAQGQVDALTSFVYNAGLGQLDNLTAKGKRTNEQIAQSLLLYNKARDSKTQKVEEVPGLTKRRQEELSMFQGAKNGGVFDGPMSGYPMTLHGNEAVIPLKDGAVPVTMNQDFTATMTNMTELIDIMKTNVNMQSSMLAVLEEIRRSQVTTADNTGRMATYASN